MGNAMPVTGVDEQGVRVGGRRLSWAAITLICLNLVLIGLTAYAYLEFGSILRALSIARGEYLSVDQASKSFGPIEPGRVTAVSFVITNRGDHPVRILGYRAGNCYTAPADLLPITIAPRERRRFRIRVATPGSLKPQTLLLSGVLLTTSPGQRELELAISGEVRGDRPSATHP